MLTANQDSSTVSDVAPSCQPKFIFVLQLVDGRFVIGQANNACKRIAAINSGLNKAIPKSLQVQSICGIKPQDGTRSFVSVVSGFVYKYGVDRVLAV
jgi:hypothetical protein